MQLATDLRIKTTHYIITGFSLVVALSWNETIKNAVNMVFPIEGEAIIARVIYSIIITLLLIIIIRYMPSTDKELPPLIKKEVFRSYHH